MTDTKQTKDVDLSNKLDLTSIYPTAKTSEDRYKDDQDRERMMLSRQPRHLAFTTATRLFVIIALGMMLYKVAPSIVAWNVLSGAFNVVLGALAMLAIVKWQTGLISTAMDKKGVNDSSFYGVYVAVCVAPMIIACYYINLQSNTNTLFALYIGLYTVHFLFVFTLIQILLHRNNY